MWLRAGGPLQLLFLLRKLQARVSVLASAPLSSRLLPNECPLVPAKQCYEFADGWGTVIVAIARTLDVGCCSR